jgi:hypothetical protein
MSYREAYCNNHPECLPFPVILLYFPGRQATQQAGSFTELNLTASNILQGENGTTELPPDRCYRGHNAGIIIAYQKTRPIQR